MWGHIPVFLIDRKVYQLFLYPVLLMYQPFLQRGKYVNNACILLCPWKCLPASFIVAGSYGKHFHSCVCVGFWSWNLPITESHSQGYLHLLDLVLYFTVVSDMHSKHFTACHKTFHFLSVYLKLIFNTDIVSLHNFRGDIYKNTKAQSKNLY